MKKYAIIGYPLGHTLSPMIHEALFELSGISDFQYSVIEIPAESLAESFSDLKTLDGLNVTIPHKIPVIEMCDELDETAERYHSVNCISCANGKTKGYNTDCVGFTLAIKNMGASLSGKVLLLGCGGVGRMMAIEKVREGGDITIAVRSEDMPAATKLCEELHLINPEINTQVRLLDTVSGDYDLCINATPVGMYPNMYASPLSEAQLEKITAAHYFDAIYNPRETTLMKLFKAKGTNAASGMDMLVWQAVAAHTIWDGSKYKEEDINRIIEEMKDLV